MKRSAERSERKRLWWGATPPASRIASLLLVVAAAGCGDLTSGGFGEVEVEVASDTLPVSTPRTAGFRSADATAADTIEGELSIEVRVRIRDRGGRWLDVSDGFQSVALGLGRIESVQLGRQSLPAGGYDRVELAFGRVEALVRRGLTIDGEPVEGRVPVELGSEGRIVVRRPLEIDLIEEELITLVLEMRAPRWLRRFNRIRRLVEKRDFRELIRVRVRADR